MRNSDEAGMIEYKNKLTLALSSGVFSEYPVSRCPQVFNFMFTLAPNDELLQRRFGSKRHIALLNGQLGGPIFYHKQDQPTFARA
jgi:hypothetical protein